MMRFSWALAVAVVLSMSSNFARADRPTSEPKSIYSVDFYRDGGIILGSTLISALAYSNGNALIRTKCPCSRDEVNAFDRSAIGNENPAAGRASDITVAASVVAPIFLDWREVGASRAWAEDMIVFTEALSVNGAMVTLAKYTVQRPLPRTYAGDPSLAGGPGGYRSFYSGHTSLTAAAMTSAAMTYTYRHPDAIWPWIVDGLVTTSVAIERVADGRHFPSDVIVGAGMGSLVGWAVSSTHHRGDDKVVLVAPMDSGLVALLRASF